MAKKRITLPKDFEEIMERNDISELAKVYETCDINAYERDWMKTPAYFAMGNPIPATDFSPSPTPSRQQDENEELTDLAKGIHAGSTEDDFNRLQDLAVKWVLANPMPIKLGKVGYRR